MPRMEKNNDKQVYLQLKVTFYIPLAWEARCHHIKTSFAWIARYPFSNTELIHKGSIMFE